MSGSSPPTDRDADADVDVDVDPALPESTQSDENHPCAFSLSTGGLAFRCPDCGTTTLSRVGIKAHINNSPGCGAGGSAHHS